MEVVTNWWSHVVESAETLVAALTVKGVTGGGNFVKHANPDGTTYTVFSMTEYDGRHYDHQFRQVRCVPVVSPLGCL